VAEQTIGNWTQTELIRFLRDYQDQQPQTFFGKLRIDQLQVDTRLQLKPTSVVLLTSNDFYVVGDQGSPGFENSWVNYDAALWAKAGYWKDPFDQVHLKGRVKTGAIGNAIFTLPPGFRPYENRSYAVDSNSAHGTLNVLTNGQVTPSAGSSTWVSLDGVYFRTSL
jgi:hypothetical protein